MVHLYHVSHKIKYIQIYHHRISGVGFNGFMFTGVPVGTHFVRVRNTGSSLILATLGPLTLFRFTTTWITQGTYITLAAINSSDPNATYECQLDNQPFVPCKYLLSSYIKLVVHII